MTRRARLRPLHAVRTLDTTAAREAGRVGVPSVAVPTAPPPVPLASPPSVRRGDWREDAACLDSDPEAFFPESYRAERDVRPARRICGRCPVRDRCLTHVMATEDPARRFGVYGGTTPDERSALHRAGLTIVSSIAPAPAGGDAA